ncbi:MAG: thioredoxin domain-containing protein, partial [Desulfovibrionales bacterium]
MPVVFRSLSAFIMISLLTAVSMLHAEDLEMITSADVEEMVGKSECNLHLVFFWATWCGPCKLEFPNYIRARQEYSDENLCISGISLDYDPSMAADYLERTEVNFPVYL